MLSKKNLHMTHEWNMFKKPLLIVLFIFWAQHSSCAVEVLFEIVKEGWKLLEFLNDVKSTKDTGVDIISLLTNTDDHQEIVEEFKKINVKLDNLKAYTKDKDDYMTLLIQQLPDELAIQSKIEKLNPFIAITYHLWIKLIYYIETNDTAGFNHLTEDIIDELEYPLIKFRQNLTPLSDAIPDKGLFMLIVENAHKKRDILCGHGETSHHIVVRLFYIAMCTEIKAHTLLFFAHLFRAEKSSDSVGWKFLLEKAFREQLGILFNVFSTSLRIKNPPYIRACDPNAWLLDKNYFGLYGYLQQTIYHVPHCTNSGIPACHDLNLGIRSRGVSDKRTCSMIPLGRHAECDGKPFGCGAFMPLFTELFTCAWEHGPYRIRFIKSWWRYYGTDKTSIAQSKAEDRIVCPSYAMTVQSCLDYNLGTRVVCSCQCSESRVRISLEMTSSRINNNYVIVGLRIRQRKNFIYIQIAEGKLEANGYIANHLWVEPGPEMFGWNYLESGRVTDRHNSFFLGDFKLRPGLALTGIKFTRMSTNRVEGFAVHVRGQEFDYKTGKLNEKLNYYDFVESGSNHELTIPTRTPINMGTHERSSPKSDGYTHVKFQQSDLSDDYGQTTLPLLDGVEILTEPLSPIGGVGLFYKGYAENYAGFLSLRVYPINFTYFMGAFNESHNVNSLLNWNN